MSLEGLEANFIGIFLDRGLGIGIFCVMQHLKFQDLDFIFNARTMVEEEVKKIVFFLLIPCTYMRSKSII